MYVKGEERISDDKYKAYEFLIKLDTAVETGQIKSVSRNMMCNMPVGLKTGEYFVIDFQEALKYSNEISNKDKPAIDSLFDFLERYKFEDLYHGYTTIDFFESSKLKIIICELSIDYEVKHFEQNSDFTEKMNWAKNQNLIDFHDLDNISIHVPIRIRINSIN